MSKRLTFEEVSKAFYKKMKEQDSSKREVLEKGCFDKNFKSCKYSVVSYCCNPPVIMVGFKTLNEIVEYYKLDLGEEDIKPSYAYSKYKLQLVKESSNIYEIDSIIDGPKSVAKIATEILKIHEEPEEVLCMLSLNKKNHVIGIFEVSRGSLDSSLFSPREILKRALLLNSASIVMIHNHPSTDPRESKEDINVTLRLKECCKLLAIDLIDHVIIGDEKNYKSLKQEGVI